MKFGFRTAAVRAAGYPKTDDVTAKKLKSSSEIIVKNGSNLFRLPAMTFAKVSVGAGADGAFSLLGTSVAGVETNLASFGSIKAANNALDRVSSVYAGLGGGVRWTRVAICLVIAYALVSVFSGAVMTSAAASVAARNKVMQSPSGALPQAAEAAALPVGQVASAQAAQAAQPVRFNPNEPSLEELERLAKGGEYKFEPKITMPNVQAPVLDCAPHPAK